jgi:hypothetical protein
MKFIPSQKQENPAVPIWQHYRSSKYERQGPSDSRCLVWKYLRGQQILRKEKIRQIRR